MASWGSLSPRKSLVTSFVTYVNSLHNMYIPDIDNGGISHVFSQNHTNINLTNVIDVLTWGSTVEIPTVTLLFGY